MNKLDLLLRSRRVVFADGVRPASVGVQGGRIVFVGGYGWDSAADAVEDVGDFLVFPGVIDPHVHLKEPGPHTHRENWESGTRQAAAGGVTTVIEMPLSVPLTVDKKGFDIKMDVASRKSHVDFALWGGMNIYAAGKYREMHSLGCAAYKAFLSTDPDSPKLGDYDFLKALADVASFGGLVGVHCENADIIDRYCEAMEKAGRNDAMAHKDSRPDVAEVEAVQRTLLFAKTTGARIHICHMSSAQSSDVMKFYKAAGVDFTAETCPSYLALDDSVLTRFGGAAKFNPPVRDAANREALWRMIENDEITMIGSDHSPYVDADRQKPIWQVPPGMSGIDLMLPVFIDTGLHGRGLTPEKIAALLSGNTAKRFGLYPRKGAIMPGADADFAVVDPDAEWTWSWKMSLGVSKETNTPYEGRRFKGKVAASYVRGKKVYDGERNVVLTEPGYGRFVRPE